MTARRGFRIAQCVIAVALFVPAVLGATAWSLTTPAVTADLVQRYYDRASRVDPPTAVRAAELVRRYVTDASSPPLPATVAGRPGFDASEAGHLRDVRGVLRGAGSAALACWMVLIGWAAFATARGGVSRLKGPVFAGGLACVAVAAAGGLAAGLGFDRFFAAFHGLFFVEGTWTFPPDALLIQLFPEPVWVALGAAWAALIAVSGLVLVLASRLIAPSPFSGREA